MHELSSFVLVFLFFFFPHINQKVWKRMRLTLAEMGVEAAEPILQLNAAINPKLSKDHPIFRNVPV